MFCFLARELRRWAEQIVQELASRLDPKLPIRRQGNFNRSRLNLPACLTTLKEEWGQGSGSSLLRRQRSRTPISGAGAGPCSHVDRAHIVITAAGCEAFGRHFLDPRKIALG